VIQALPTYRRDVLLLLSGFAETGCECELTTALPLLDVAEIRLLPEFVCARRRRGCWRHFARHASLGFRSRKHQSHLPAWLSYALPLLLGIGLARRVIYRMKEATMVGFRSTLAISRSLARRWRFRAGLLYAELRRHLAWWPISWLHPSGFRERGPQRKVAYVFWRYPILTETFIRREMKALRETGISIQIVAEYRGDSTDMPCELFDVCHLSALDPRELRHLSRRVLMRRPLASLNLLLYTVFHDYRLNKSPYTDIDVFRRAARLAAVLQKLGVTHVHAPWADSEAFVAKLSAWLLKLPYTVHARAHEIHSRSFNSGIVENLKGARFVVLQQRI